MAKLGLDYIDFTSSFGAVYINRSTEKSEIHVLKLSEPGESLNVLIHTGGDRLDQVRYGGIRRCSASPRPTCGGTP